MGRCAGLGSMGRPFGLGRWNLSELSDLSPWMSGTMEFTDI